MAPTIVTQPQSQIVALGGTATFSVAALGTLPFTYQWTDNGTNVVNATNASLTITNVQITNAGSYAAIVSNAGGSTISSNAVLAVGHPPAITNQPQGIEVVQGTNVSFTVGATGTAPLNYQWYFDGSALNSATNAILALNDVQPTNGGVYYVVVTNLFGSVTSTNATLTVEPTPVIVTQPQGQSALPGSTVIFSVVATNPAPTLPTVSSGTLALWLKGNAGVVTNSSGLVSEWLDQSGNSNNASQANSSYQPSLVYPQALNGNAAVRFNGVLDAVNGYWLHGTGNVGLSNALTGFMIYNSFVTSPNDIYGQVVWFVGVPGGSSTACRGASIYHGHLDFTVWNGNYGPSSWSLPTDTYRICTDRLNSSLSTAEIFDYSSTTATNFVESVSGLQAPPAAGYYVGGLDPTVNGLGHSRCFDGDIAEVLLYQGYLSDADRLAVTGYLQQKYYQVGGVLAYQWQFDGANIAGATNASLTVTNVQEANAGTYDVIVYNGAASTVSSNAVLVVELPPAIVTQPSSTTVNYHGTAYFEVAATGDVPMSYQWQVDGFNVPGGSGASMAIPNAVPADGGSYSVIITNDAGVAVSSNAVLLVNYVLNSVEGHSQQIPAARLTSPSAVQPGVTFNVTSVDSTSAQGGTVQFSGGTISYTPPVAFIGADSFNYVLTPSTGPAIKDEITVNIDISLLLQGTLANGMATLKFAGIPQTVYDIEASTDLQHWTVIGSVTSGPNGQFIFTDENAWQYPQRFYRTMIP